MLDAAGWFVAAGAVMITGMSKTGLGGAFGGLAVPLMSIWMAPREAAAVMLPILLLMDAIGVRAYWGQWDRGELLRLVPAAWTGIVAGAFAFGTLPEFAVKGIVGVISLGFAVYRFVGARRPAGAGSSKARGGVLWGAVSGFTSTIAHAGGPPLLVYLLRRDLDKRRFLATTVFFFAAVNLSKVLPYWELHLISRRTLLTSATLLPCAPLGTWFGLALQRRIPERAFFVVATTLLALSGAKLLADAIGAALTIGLAH